MMFSELQDEVYRLLRDPQQTKYNLVSVKRRINSAEQLFCTAVKMKIIVDSSTSTTAGKNDYALPTGYDSEIGIFYDGDEIKEIDVVTAQKNWMQNQTPRHYYTLTDGNIYLVGSVAEGKTLKIIYYSIGGAMFDDANIPVVPVKFHMALVFLSAFICAREGDDVRADQFYTDFTKIAQLAGYAEVDERFGNRWPVIGEGGDGVYVPNDEDLYSG